MSVPLLATWPAMEEREKEIFVGDILVEVCGSWDFGKDWNFGEWKSLWIMEEGKKENRKRKRKWKREIILLEEKVKNNESGGCPGLSCRCGNLSGKYRNRPKFKYLGTTRNNYQKSRIIY